MTDTFLPQPAVRTPLLLKFNGEAVGTIALDELDGGRGAIRLVAISEECQGQGCGRVLGQLVEAFARDRGVTRLCVNADPEKTGYYASLGFKEQIWDATEMAAFEHSDPKPAQMVKRL